MTAPEFLFGVDLEDVRLHLAGGDRHRERVPETTGRFLDFLDRHGAKATFFVVGEVARLYPVLVRRIAAAGHELACHSDRHVALEQQGPQAFRDDLLRNLEALADAGATDVRGYRAPGFSLTAQTAWAYPILAELGFHYSSSVLPARNPLYGWPGFGAAPRLIDGIVELPMTLTPWRLLPVPIGGGVYFRALPKALLRRALASRAKEGAPVLGYFHPYDVDEEQERFAFPGFSRFGIFNRLLYFNRGAVFDRLAMVAALGYRITGYRGHAERVRLALAKES